MNYPMTLTGTKESGIRTGRIMLCNAAEVLSTFDTLMDYAQQHGITDARIKFLGSTYETRIEFLDMIFTINAYSTAHNGTKIFM